MMGAMGEPMELDDFLSGQSDQGSAFEATLEAIPDQPTLVKVTPFHSGYGCECASSFELARDAVQSVTPTGTYHFCCGKRLEVAVVEFTEDAVVPVTQLMARPDHADLQTATPFGLQPATMPYGLGPGPGTPQAGARRGPGSAGIVGRWPIPWTPCEVVCIEVCTRFCHDWGWDCCEWQTRCTINCNRVIA